MGDSVGEIFQSVGLSSIGAPGTTAVLAMLNDAVKKGGAFASSHVGGLSGAFIPVSEDSSIEAATRSGALTLEKLEAMTSVCSVGLDMIAIPGSTPAATISGIIADEMAIGMINSKTTAVRVIPVPGKGVGEKACFGGCSARPTSFPCPAATLRRSSTWAVASRADSQSEELGTAFLRWNQNGKRAAWICSCGPFCVCRYGQTRRTMAAGRLSGLAALRHISCAAAEFAYLFLSEPCPVMSRSELTMAERIPPSGMIV